MNPFQTDQTAKSAPPMSEEDMEVARLIIARNVGSQFRPAPPGEGRLGTLLPPAQEPEP